MSGRNTHAALNQLPIAAREFSREERVFARVGVHVDVPVTRPASGFGSTVTARYEERSHESVRGNGHEAAAVAAAAAMRWDRRGGKSANDAAEPV